MLDKAEFPRDKVCGELMHKKAVETLEEILPGFTSDFTGFSKTLVLKKTKVHYKEQVLDFSWQNASYTCKRVDLDNYLLNTVKSKTDTYIQTGIALGKPEIKDNKVVIETTDGTQQFTGKMVIGADGAHSIVAKTFASKTVNKEQYLGAVRAYYSNIEGLSPDTAEVFFNTRNRFNYLWVFPVSGGEANVGFGLLSNNISKNKLSLKDEFKNYFIESDILKKKFENAVETHPLEGFGVPLGPDMGISCGERFLLVGDAAALSNPLSGTGIGNAVVSAKLAGEQVLRCFKSNNFSDSFMQSYRDALQVNIVNGLQQSLKTQRFISKMPFLLDLVFFLARSKRFRHFIQSRV